MIIKLLAYMLLVTTILPSYHVNAFVKVSPNKLQHLPTFKSSGFKSLLLHDDKLYVGGLDHLYTQNPERIDESVDDDVEWKARQTSRCRSPKICSNYIRSIIPYNQTHLLLCGAMTQTATNAYYNIQTGELNEESGKRDEVVCSATPTETITSQIITTSTTNNTQIVATSRPEKRFSSNIRLIKTLENEDTVIKTPEKLFRDPHFAASFVAYDEETNDEKVYFILHEKAEQPKTVGRATRIVQVCSNDEGYLSYTSGNNGELHWTSLLSLRLVCAVGNREDKSLYLDYVTDMIVDGKYLYGTFTNPDSGIHRTSAICAFSLAKIQQTFRDGNFWHFNPVLGSYELFLRQDIEEEPVGITPGKCLHPSSGMVNSTRDYNPKYTKWLEEHALLHEEVESIDPKKSTVDTSPLFLMQYQHFTTIASYEATSLDGDKYRNYFVGTTSGLLIKLRQIDEKSSKMVKVVEYQISDDPIKTLQISSKYDLLYVSTQSAIKQMPLSDCGIYQCEFCNPCKMCILSHDPSCAWNTKEQKCTSFGSNETSDNSHLIQHLHSNNVDICGDAINKTYYKSAPPSDATVVYGEKSETMNAKWMKQDGQVITDISFADEKFEKDQMKRLIINNFNISADYGTYICEYSIDDVIVGRLSYVVSNIIPPVDEGNNVITKNPHKTVNPSSKGGDDDETPVVTIETPVYTDITTVNNNGTVVNEASFSKIPLQILIAVIAVVIILLIFVLFYRIKRRSGFNCCEQKMSDYEMNTNPNTNTQSSPQSMDTNKNMNMSCNNEKKQQQVEDEFDYYQQQPGSHGGAGGDSDSYQPEKENLIGTHGRKVAAVKPNNCSMSLEDDIPYVDDNYDVMDGLIATRTSPLATSPLQTSMTLGRHDTRKKKRNLVNRSTSIPAQKIFVTVNNQKHRCSKIIKTERDTYIFEVSGLSTDLQITGLNGDHDSDMSSTDIPLLTTQHDGGDIVTPESSSDNQYTTAPPSPFKMTTTSQRSSYA